MTSAQGSGVRGRRKPSRSGLSLFIDRLDGVPAELVAEGGVHLRGERLVLARRESREEGERDRRCRNGFVDRLEDRPAALARVLDVAADLLEVVILLECEHEQVEEPA